MLQKEKSVILKSIHKFKVFFFRVLITAQNKMGEIRNELPSPSLFRGLNSLYLIEKEIHITLIKPVR